MRIVIVGSGNVATVLGRRIKKTNHQIIQVISRQIEHAKELANELECGFADFSGKQEEADLYLFAVTDGALLDMDKIFKLGDKLAIHTAGSVSKDLLQNISSNYGVLYPLQSLQKKLEEIKEIPFVVDGNNEATTLQIENFAKELDPVVSRGGDDARLKIHVAAVFINNFTNHLYLQAEDFCNKENLDFNLLKPLMMETAHRILTHSPKDVLTGPAVRNDVFTLEKHLRLLTNHPKQKYLYLKLTDSIINK